MDIPEELLDLTPEQAKAFAGLKRAHFISGEEVTWSYSQEYEKEKS